MKTYPPWVKGWQPCGVKHAANPTFLSVQGPLRPLKGAPVGVQTPKNIKLQTQTQEYPKLIHPHKHMYSFYSVSEQKWRFKSLKSFSKLQHNFVGFTNLKPNSRCHYFTLYVWWDRQNRWHSIFPHNPFTNRQYLCYSHVSVIPDIWL